MFLVSEQFEVERRRQRCRKSADSRFVQLVQMLGEIERILFTSDDQLETRTQAIRAGADEVVLKTSAAHELIDIIVRLADDMQVGADHAQVEAHEFAHNATAPSAEAALSR